VEAEDSQVAVALEAEPELEVELEVEPGVELTATPSDDSSLLAKQTLPGLQAQLLGLQVKRA
jgi:hypothetical protein